MLRIRGNCPLLSSVDVTILSSAVCEIPCIVTPCSLSLGIIALCPVNFSTCLALLMILNINFSALVRHISVFLGSIIPRSCCSMFWILWPLVTKSMTICAARRVNAPSLRSLLSIITK